MTTYEVVAIDAQTNEPMVSLPATNLKFGATLNALGACTFTLPLDHPAVVGGNLQPGRRDVGIYRNGPGGGVWTGPVVDLEADLDAGTVQIACRQYLYHLERRSLETDYAYSNQTPLVVAGQLLFRATSKTGGGLPHLQFGSYAGIPGTPDPIVAGRFDGINRASILSLILDAGRSPDTGYDLLPAEETSTPSSPYRFLRHTWLVYPYVAHVASIPRVVLDEGSGLVGLTQTESVEGAANRVHVQGKDGSVDVVAAEGSVFSLSQPSSFTAGKTLWESPLLQSPESGKARISDVAREYRRVLEVPLTRYSARWRHPGEFLFAPGRPLPPLGQEVTVRVARGYLNVNKNLRVQGYSVEVDDNGSEIIEFDLVDPLPGSG